MPKCKTCSHYWHKDWSINFECKLGHNTPDFGDTDACSSYEEQYTFGKERGWSYKNKRAQGKSDSNNSNQQALTSELPIESQTSYSYEGGDSSGGSSGSNFVKGCLFAIALIPMGIIAFLSQVFFWIGAFCTVVGLIMTLTGQVNGIQVLLSGSITAFIGYLGNKAYDRFLGIK